MTSDNSNPAPELRIDMEKMLRFSRWYFAKEPVRKDRVEEPAEEQPQDPKSSEPSAA